MHLREHRVCYASALRYVGQNSLRDSMYETNEEYMVDCWKAAHNVDVVPYEDLSAVRIAAAGATKVIEIWVVEGCVQDPDEVVDAIVSNIPPEVLATLY